MKEYLNIVLGSMIGVIITVIWSQIKTHFRSKQNAKDIKDMNAELVELKKDVGETKVHVAVIKETVSTIKDQNRTLLDLFNTHIVNK